MKKELYPVGSTVHLRGDEAVYWIIIGLVWMVDGGTVSVFMPLKAFPVGTGSVQGNTVWYLVVLGQYRAVAVNLTKILLFFNKWLSWSPFENYALINIV